MKNIEFLPPRYQVQRVERRSKLWRLSLLLLFGSICSATAIGQKSLRRTVAAQLSTVQATHSQARAATDQFDRLQEQLADVEATAGLYTYLKHSWPRTQILVAVARPLPHSVSLTQLRIRPHADDIHSGGNRRERGRRERRGEHESKQLRPAQRDLLKIREVLPSQCVVELRGLTTNVAQLHQYVAELGEVELFAKAELVSLETVEKRAHSASSKFNLRLVVRPGHGSPDGPSSAEKNGGAAKETAHDAI